MSGLSPGRDAANSWGTKLMLAGGAAVTVWAIYHPADSTAVEQGAALGLTLAVLLWVLAAGMVYRLTPSFSWQQPSWWCDVAALSLAAWVFFSAWVTAGTFSAVPPTIGGDLRSATNEAWWWIAAAGFFVTIRRAMSIASHVQAMCGLLLGLGTLLAVHTLHQHYVSFPQTLREYSSDPDGMLAQIGLEAPLGSAARMIFENRLRDGGPTATFALANSLAGPLAMLLTLGGGCLVCWLPRWRRPTSAAIKPPMWFLAVVGSVCALVLWALVITNSRSGLLSVPMAGVGAFVWCRMRSIQRVRNRLFIAGLLAVGLALGSMLSLSSGTPSDGDSMTGASATIGLRLQYWRSTLALAGDAPWFGAGPGNFQLVYQKYREIGAHELIAEPHNFLMETLASGGWLGVLLLLVSAIAGYLVYCGISDPSSAEQPATKQDQRWIEIAVSGGAFVGLLSVWYAGILGNDLPDFDAHLIAVPIAIAVVASWMGAALASPDAFANTPWRGIALAATATGLIHLCFSAGWTIPGVSVVLLSLAGIVTGVPANALERRLVNARADRIQQAAVGIAWSIVVLWLIFFSWRPVVQSRERMMGASQLMQTNRERLAVQELQQAMAVDPLNRDAPIWKATIENRALMALLLTKNALPPRQLADADQAFAIAIERAGNDPVRLRAISDLLVQRYQVAGRIEDLQAASELVAKARDLSPMHETITAQLAEVVRELNERGVAVPGPAAKELAERAVILANSGGAVVTRQLALQPIMAARVIGRPAIAAPLRIPASDVQSLVE